MDCEILKTNIEDCCTIKSTGIFTDKRGTFFEAQSNFDLPWAFVQDNLCYTHANTLRGVHIQSKNPAGKFIRVLRGSVFSVCVDMRKNSETFGRFFGVTLTEFNRTAFYIPEGCAHGAYTYEESIIYYKLTEFYDKQSDGGIIWNDKLVGIEWPSARPIISDKDLSLPSLDQYMSRLSQ